MSKQVPAWARRDADFFNLQKKGQTMSTMKTKKATVVEVFDLEGGGFGFRTVCPQNRKKYGHDYDSRSGAVRGVRDLIAAMRGPIEIVHVQRTTGEFKKGGPKYAPAPNRPNDYVPSAEQAFVERITQLVK